MTRYLLYISYLGTKFRGVQKQLVNAESTKSDPESVQGILEICSKRFKPVNEPHVYMSSRTDRGVHALCSSAHVDLEHAGGLTYHPAHLTVGYNRYFAEAELDVRVQSVHIVPETFHARFSAKSRTYLYRLAVRNPDAPPINGNSSWMVEIPFLEWNRCHFIQKVDKFDVSLLKAAAALFPGTKDFRTFMGNKAKLPPDISTVKEMYRLDITPGTPLLGAEYSSCCSYYTFWDITCQARSFLYRQVRRMVGALISVAVGHISIEEIRYMLESPSKNSWNSRINVVPPYGLYLVGVEYDPLEIVMPQEISEQDQKRNTALLGQVE
ncbi:tRNA pseudouridine synthase-like 1 [Cryptotermes secundus]|uniref:tRNA pseudouridine synthase n=1 Tax=Cryptotermes secundus TaxID=105785 RepID=A0A2J7PPY1_9NEOP|nr:tRNA pseudouridine synthase-like 1 isoform X2 [Cryptotermes secundus]PNF18392.1 tRNA pseudouridine synthase-like 1 [Cryptotermes secundus]